MNILFVCSYVNFFPNFDCICQGSAFSKTTLTKVSPSSGTCNQVIDLKSWNISLRSVESVVFLVSEADFYFFCPSTRKFIHSRTGIDRPLNPSNLSLSVKFKDMFVYLVTFAWVFIKSIDQSNHICISHNHSDTIIFVQKLRLKSIRSRFNKT